MRRFVPLICLLTACSATKGLQDLGDTVDCALGCGFANGVGVCGQNGCEFYKCNDGFADCNGQTSDGCEVDVHTDPTNCALCGNVCDTGVCRQGSCQDVNVVASPPGDGREVTDFVVDPSGVYFVLAPGPELLYAGTPESVSLEFVAQAGTEPVSLAETSGVAASLAAGEDRLCWLVGESTSLSPPYRLLSLPKAGGETTLLASGNQQLSGLAVLEPYVYWIIGGPFYVTMPDGDGGLSSESRDQTLRRVLITGGPDEALASWMKPDLVSLLTAGSGMLVLAQSTLVDTDAGAPQVNAKGLFSFDPASRAEAELSSGTPSPGQAVLKDGILYWVRSGYAATAASSIASVPLGGGTPTTLWTSKTMAIAAGMAVTDRYFFLTGSIVRSGTNALGTTYFDGILRIDRSSGQETLVASRGAPTSHVLVDAEYVYWLESGQILRTPQSGSAG